MLRLRTISRAGAFLAAFAIGALGHADEPAGGKLTPVAAPRTDVYSVYSDAYFNPNTLGPKHLHAEDACPPAQQPSYMGNLFTPQRHWRFYAGGEYMSMQRSKPAIQTLAFFGTFATRTPPNVIATTDDFDYGGPQNGWKAWLGVAFTDTDRVDVAFHRWNGIARTDVQIRDNGFDLTSFFYGQDFLAFDFGVNEIDASYRTDAFWGVDSLWRHDFKDFCEWHGLNWMLTSLAGVRVINSKEMLAYRSQAFLLGNEVDQRIAIENMMVGPQIGVQATRKFCGGLLGVDLLSKGSFAANFQRVHERTTSTFNIAALDEFREYEKEHATTAGILECQAKVNFFPHESIKLFVGLESLYLMNIGTATKQMSENLDMTRRPTRRDNILYVGWVAGGEVVF